MQTYQEKRKHRKRNSSLFDQSAAPSLRTGHRCRSPLSIRNPNADNRVIINVQGRKYETYEATLDYFPDTLLGNQNTRRKYRGSTSREIILSRDPQVFEAVLFYYQSKGILAKPSWVSQSEFERELQFYKLMKDEELVLVVPESRRFGMIWNLLEHPRSSKYALILSVFSVLTIILSTATFCVESLPSIADPTSAKEFYYKNHVLHSMETAFIAWFTLEYALRLLSAPKRLKFVTSLMGIIDLIVILPFYVALLMDPNEVIMSLYIIRIIRMIRVFRILKLTRYSTGLTVLGKTIYESLGQLIALFLCLFLSAIMFASLIYYMEHKPGGGHTFQSIPDAFWYVLITKTTVGYGDVIPQTILGRVTASMCMICGIIILLCLPTPIFITHFGRFYKMVIREPITTDGGEESVDIENNLLLVPTWMQDREWTKKLTNDYKQNVCLNIYLSNVSIRTAVSNEVINSKLT